MSTPTAGHPSGWPAPRTSRTVALELIELLREVQQYAIMPQSLSERVMTSAFTAYRELTDKLDGPVPSDYDRDDLDEANLGVLLAYGNVRARLVAAFDGDRMARRVATGVLDDLARDLILNNTDDDEDPDDDL